MNNIRGFELERKIVRALPGLFLDSADLRLHPKAGAGATGLGADAVFDLEIDDLRIPVHVEVKSRSSPNSEEQVRERAAHLPQGIALLVLPRIPQPVRARLRAAGISHADLTGTIYLRAAGVRIDIVGTRRPPRLSERQRVNPFSKRASLVVRALLAEPSAELGVTVLAGRLGIAKGWVSQVLAELVARDWVKEAGGGVQLTDPVTLLRTWSLEYTWRQNDATGFTLPFDNENILKRLAGSLAGLRWALTLQGGASQLAPHAHYNGQLHLYVDLVDHDAAVECLQDELHAEPTPGAGNLQILAPYYGAATFHDLRQRGALPIVSPVQLFLDLAHFPVRGAEAATALARAVLASELHLEPTDVRRLVEDLA